MDSVNPGTGRGPHGVFEASRDKRAHGRTHFWRELNGETMTHSLVVRQSMPKKAGFYKLSP